MTETQTEELTPKKKRAVVEYLGIMFAAAFLLVALSLLLKLGSVKNAHEGAQHDNATLQSNLAEAENSLEATSLLVLAQDAYYRADETAFREYMTRLAEVADSLPENSREVYEALSANLT